MKKPAKIPVNLTLALLGQKLERTEFIDADEIADTIKSYWKDYISVHLGILKGNRLYVYVNDLDFEIVEQDLIGLFESEKEYVEEDEYYRDDFIEGLEKLIGCLEKFRKEMREKK